MSADGAFQMRGLLLRTANLNANPRSGSVPTISGTIIFLYLADADVDLIRTSQFIMRPHHFLIKMYVNSQPVE